MKHRYFLAAGLLLLACNRGDGHDDRGRRDHGDHGHDDHGHGGHDYPAVVVTHFTEQTELFVEYPALTVGRKSAFAVHLTRLSDFKPVREGKVVVILSGAGSPEERFEAQPSKTPGIFRPVALPKHGGKRTLTVQLEGKLSAKHELGVRDVFASSDKARAGTAEVPDSPGAISFLKEQQWKVQFATATVSERKLRASVRTTGHIRARAGGEAKVSAPVSGRVTTAADKLPTIGRDVKRGEVLLALSPRLGDSADIATLDLDVSRGRAQHDLDKKDLERLEALLAEGAVAERRVEVARKRLATSLAEVSAAKRRVAQYRGNQSLSGGGSRLQVRSPIDGTVVETFITSGAFVEEGKSLIHVVDLDRLWLEADIPAADVGRLRGASGVWFEVEGYPKPFEIDLENGGKLVAFGGVINPRTRTAPLVFEFENNDRAFAVNLFAKMHILTGTSQQSLAVPTGAIIDDAGKDVVYVQTSGESYERRIVELGPSDRGWVAVTSGLRPGARVATVGAYYVHLAGASTSVPAHGHAH